MAFKIGNIDFTWARLTPDPGLGNLAGLFTTESEWQHQGHNVDELETLSVSEAWQRQEPIRIPQRLDLLLSLHTLNEIRIVRVPLGQFSQDPPVVVAADFDDPHPQKWVEKLSADGRALLAIGPKYLDAFATLYDWQQTWRIIVIGVAKGLYDNGVGIVPHGS